MVLLIPQDGYNNNNNNNNNNNIFFLNKHYCLVDLITYYCLSI